MVYMNNTATQQKPIQVGDGATLCYWSDRHAGTIIAVSPSGKRISVQRDIATRVDSNGMSGNQEYTFLPNPASHIYEFTMRKNGYFVQVGEDMKNGTICHTTGRYEYYDFSF